jgi:hypothetical protein
MTSMTHVLRNPYSLLSTLPIASFAQVTTPFARRSTSAFVFPLCKHTLTLSLPLGTVGHVIGRTFMPSATRYADSGRGCGVSIGMIGDDKVRWGSEINSEGILCDSRSGLNDCIKYEERSRSLVDSLRYFLISFFHCKFENDLHIVQSRL